MPSRRSPEPPPLEIRQFTPDEIDLGLKRLKRRITDLEAFDPRKALDQGDSSKEVLARDIRDTIRDVFGLNSAEARDFAFPHIWSGPAGINMSPEAVHEGYRAGRLAYLQKLEGLVRRLEEKRGDLVVDVTERGRSTFRGLDLHPRIAVVATELYLDGHHAEAVFNASKALVHFVKERSGRHDLDGAGLMTTVFSKKNPLLAFNMLKDQTEEDEQEGMMHLFAGAVLAIRNPGGHDFPEMSPERALELIALLSFLANRAQEAKKPK